MAKSKGFHISECKFYIWHVSGSVHNNSFSSHCLLLISSINSKTERDNKALQNKQKIA